MFDAYFPWVVAGSTMVDALTGALALLMTWSVGAPEARAPIGLRRIVVAAAATTAMFLLKLVFLSRLGLGSFGLIHLVYADATVALPAIGVLLLLGSSRKL